MLSALPLVDGLTTWADHLVYGELVARLARLPAAIDGAALSKGIAVLLTLIALRGALALLAGLHAVCDSPLGRSLPLRPGCWALTRALDWPDSLSEVVASLALVAAVNRLLILGSELAASHARRVAWPIFFCLPSRPPPRLQPCRRCRAAPPLAPPPFFAVLPAH
jgi:hypothetical protein